MKRFYNKKNLLFVLIFILIVFIFSLTLNSGVDNHRLQWWLDAIEWNNSYRKYSGKSIKIAVLDTGIDIEHLDFPKEIKQINIGEKSNSLSHGTGIAGIICAYPSDDNGVIGIAPDAEVISFSITNAKNDIDIENLIAAIRRSIDENVDIINISCGLSNYSSELENVIIEAYEKGIIIVASAGNFMKGEILYPAAFEKVLAVGSIDKNGNVISPTGILNKHVIFLPGENIVTTGPNDSYNSMFGSSPATAILSGIIAIILEAKPDLTNEEIYDYFNCETNNSISIRKILKEIGV